MVVFLSISIGLLIAIFSLYMIKREVMKASFFKNVHISDNVDGAVVKQLQVLEVKVDEMNQSFYDLVSDLEGKYSVHEKEIEIIDQKVNDIRLLTQDLSKMLNYQGKEIASIKEPEVKKSPGKITQKVVPDEESLELKDEIFRLMSLGYDEQQIAKKLNRGIREIKMLMKLIN